MLKNMSESITNLIKLLVSITQLAMLLAVLGGSWWAYRTISDITSSPITLPSVAMPDVKVPKVQIEAPDIELPSIKLPGQKPKIDESRWHDPVIGEYLFPTPTPTPTPPPLPPAGGQPPRATPAPAAPRYDSSKIQV